MPPGGMALFPLTQRQNLQVSWPSAIFSAMCSSAAFLGRQRRCEAAQQLALISTSSLMLVECVWALKK